jgi:hypothetical protein
LIVKDIIFFKMENQTASNGNQSPSSPLAPCPPPPPGGIPGNLVFYFMNFAASRGNHRANMYCGVHTLEGDRKTPLEVFRIGTSYFNTSPKGINNSENPNYITVKQHFAAAAASGYLPAKQCSIITLLLGIGCERDLDGAAQMLESLLEGQSKCLCCGSWGPSEYNYLLGETYLRLGRNEEAFQRLSHASEAEYAPAIQALAICYWLGLGVNVDLKKSIELILSIQGDENILPDVGYLYVTILEDARNIDLQKSKSNSCILL